MVRGRPRSRLEAVTNLWQPGGIPQKHVVSEDVRSLTISLRTTRGQLIVAVLIALLAALAVALWVSQRTAPPHSSQINCGTASSTDPRVANCLLSAYSQQRMANGTIVSSTLEGDAVIYVLTVASPTSLRAVVDNRDRYGEPGVYRYFCSGMIRDDQDRVSLNGCSGNGPLGPGATLSVPS
jgi:hypothetical protein